MPITSETHRAPGTQGVIGDAPCVWTGGRWVRKSALYGRLQELEATARYNEMHGAPRLAKMQRHDAAHIRGLLSGVPA